MRTSSAALCRNILLLLSALLDTSVRELCQCYEIQVAENYMALGGDLEVTVIDLRRSPSDQIRLELLDVEIVRVESKAVRKRDAGTSSSSSTTTTASVVERRLTEAEASDHLRVNHSALIKFIDTRNNGTGGGAEVDGGGAGDGFSNGYPDEYVTKHRQVPESMSRVFENEASSIPNHRWTVLGSIIVPPTSNGSDVVRVLFPCGVITRGGLFGLRLTGVDAGRNTAPKRRRYKWNRDDPSYKLLEESSDPNVIGLDVRWPSAILSIDPHHIETYPGVTVTATIQFLPTVCSPAVGAPLPETWLDLLACGHSLVGCTDGNSTYSQVVYSEQIVGYPRRRTITLGCELFGVAGHFALLLKSAVQSGTVIETQNKDAFLKAVWSEEYIFNVHARSIFPCDVHGGGVAVLFQYPQCILNGDRVRLFSRLRAEVSSLVPPTTLHYVTEQRVVKGKHSLHFDCDFFSERFVEYCFVYVSQAITGAVTDVRMDCVPTLPVSDSDSGGWGPWNPWSSCTTTCGGGTRNRFRYCDSPPPRYGAKYCQGPSVETESCGNDNWDCEFYQRLPPSPSSSYDPKSKGYLLPADRPEIMAEIGPGCRCGCVVHLGAAKPRRLLATSSRSCPGRFFWQIEADTEHIIRFSVEYFRFPCGSQWLKVRDGDSRSSTLIGELSMHHTTSVPVTSTGSKLLIEFFSDELLASGQECWGGFLAQAQQSQPAYTNTSTISSGFSIGNILRNLEVAPTASGSLILVHAFVALFICVVIFVSGCLGIQYIHRYRKYQVAAATEDEESVSGNSQCSLVAVRSRATSNSTLLSEVISLQRFKPNRKYKHSRLREEDNEVEEEHHLSESSDSQEEQEAKKTPTPSQTTLKAEERDGEDEHRGSTTASMQTTPRASPISPRRSNSAVVSEEPSEKCNKPQSKSVSCGLNVRSEMPYVEETGKTSPVSNASSSRGSSEAMKKIYNLRRTSLSSPSTRSGSTITNDSPASSLRSMKRRNPKESKDKRNLERLLAGSEFSLPGDGDLEMDYYDYNVHNASAVPESYIGMDPAYLIWIPPYSPVDWKDEGKEEESGSEMSEEKRQERENVELDTVQCDNSGGSGNETKTETSLVHDSSARGTRSKVSRENNRQNGAKDVERATERGRCMVVDGEEKEIRVEKSPTMHTLFSPEDDDEGEIKFADEDEDDYKIENSKCDIYSGNTNNNVNNCGRKRRKGERTCKELNLR